MDEDVLGEVHAGALTARGSAECRAAGDRRTKDKSRMELGDDHNDGKQVGLVGQIDGWRGSGHFVCERKARTGRDATVI